MPRDALLFACTENAGRSQMAAAFFTRLSQMTSSSRREEQPLPARIGKVLALDGAR